MPSFFVFFFILSSAKQKNTKTRYVLESLTVQFLFFLKINGHFGPTSGPLRKLILFGVFCAWENRSFLKYFLRPGNLSLIKSILPEIAE